MAEGRQSPPPRARLDVWLWRARVAKTRGLAAKLVSSGHVRVNGAREKAPGRGLLIGDTLTIALDRAVRVLEITAFGERRGPASEARELYREQLIATQQDDAVAER
ncbi:RNA-binding S4 domain-containing protein [Methylopila sp. M107]|uniref:RNA-binding S4 domain-containing protein n=1 Tax=Methylopila sp. M107 TaxID=1101190 RepID=UPI00035DBB84|nr:RNA-binding S4 domain-containing protein [Methylopila sp. M107]